MAQIRIGHDQIILYVNLIRVVDGEIVITANTWSVPEEKLIKLTGDQPFVLIGDDGKKVVATWHADLTENFREARENPGCPITLTQSLNIDYIKVP